MEMTHTDQAIVKSVIEGFTPCQKQVLYRALAEDLEKESVEEEPVKIKKKKMSTPNKGMLDRDTIQEG